MRYWGLLVLLFFADVAKADPKADIIKEYGRSTEASSLKYLDGVYSIRSPRFQLYNMEGLRLDLVVERSRWEQVIQPAVSVDEKVEVKSFKTDGPDKAECDAVYTTKLVLVDRLTDRQRTEVLVTGCRDEWVLLGGKWRLSVTHVTSQEFKR